MHLNSAEKKRLKSRIRQEQFEGKQFILRIYLILNRHYSNFDELLAAIPDHRQRREYQVAELIMAGISMFLFKRKSRNQADLGINETFEKNYITIFKMRVPIMDTVNVFLRELDPKELEALKTTLIKQLIKKRVFEKWRYLDRYLVAVDGTGISSYDYEPYAGCPNKTSKNGKKTWQSYVLEAKLVMGNGFCISLLSCWLENSENVEEKQDCEMKAFRRLAEALKKTYPRLPLILLADGLYANQTAFGICAKYNWAYIITMKEGNLKSVWQEIELLRPLHHQQRLERCLTMNVSKGWLTEKIQYINQLDYHGYELNWVEYESAYAGKERQEYFCYLSSFTLSKENSWAICQHGRLRWVIENEGFNTQKNQGYNLEHKYSRTSLWATKNYYELLQTAHLINQLAEKLQHIQSQLREANLTLIAVWEDIMACLRHQVIEPKDLKQVLEEYKQLRY